MDGIAVSMLGRVNGQAIAAEDLAGEFTEDVRIHQPFGAVAQADEDCLLADLHAGAAGRDQERD